VHQRSACEDPTSAPVFNVRAEGARQATTLHTHRTSACGLRSCIRT
jgi:hypothetical protein